MPDTNVSSDELRRLRKDSDAYHDDQRIYRWVVRGGLILMLGIVASIFAWKAVTPQLNLYRAETEKQAVIAEQKAESEAAEFAAKSAVIQATAKAEAEVIRAQGLADSQEIISATLTEEYLRYLYIQQLDETAGQVIYIPTEAGLPILEAGRVPPPGD